MTSQEEVGITIIVAFYVVLLLLALKVFGLRRVLWLFVLLTVLGISIAFRSLGVIVGSSRRY